MGNELLIKLREELKKNLVEEKAARFDEEYSYLLRERDTSDVWRQFAIWLLVDEDDGVIRFTKPDSIQYNAIQQVANLYIKDCKDADAFEAAADAAWSVYAPWYESEDAAARAAYYAAYAAYAAAAAADDAWSVAFDAADAAAWSVASAVAAYRADDAASAALGADTAAAKAGFFVHYGRMADKLIELISAAPMMHETQRTHCKTIANKLGDLINKQESMVDNMDNRVETVMDNSDKISFSISHHNGTKHIIRGKQGIEKQVRQIEYALSVVKALLKDNPSDAISINVGMVDGTISVTYPYK